MIYKRDEAFRYVFNPPLSCFFSIVEVNQINVHTGIGEGEIIDLSPHGLKLSSKLNILIGNAELKVKLNFKINNEVIIVIGVLEWRMEIDKNCFHYGVSFVNSHDLTDVIIKELKTFVKSKLP